MSSNYEIIRYKQGLNTRIIIHSVNQFKMHWHKELELLLVLKGNIQLIINGNRHELKEDDMFLVNAGQVHSTIGQGDNIVVAIQINFDSFDITYPQIKNIVFQWPEHEELKLYEEAFAQLRNSIAQMVGEYRRGEKGYQVAVEGYLNNLILLLLRNVPQLQKNDTLKNSKDLQRIQSIVKYIEEHYTEKISLEQIAKNEFMSTYYLSHFFKAKMGISFQEYLNYIRLNKAITQLNKSMDNITDIALNCGFANVKSFHNAFREAYGKTPGEYRRASELSIIDEMDRVAYLDFDSFQALGKLETYIQSSKEQPRLLVNYIMNQMIKINATMNGVSLAKWKRFAAVGRAYDCLRSDLQGQIRLAKKELGIEYLRFHGIFSDEMRVVTRNKDGTLKYYWQYVDLVFDFLHCLDIKPMVDFTFIPSVLSSKDITSFWYKGNITKPKKWEEWQELVHNFITHCINRYGAVAVQEWYFEIWNEPDYMWLGTTEEYYHFYKVTSQILHSIDDKLMIAGPSIMSPTKEKLKWVKQFIEFINCEKLPLNIFTYHIYGENNFIINNGSILPSLGDKQYFSNSVDDMKEIISRLNVPVSEVFITEYNISAMHKNYLLDTMFAACHTLYNFLKNTDKVNGIVPWVLSDIFEEDFELNGPFYGGFGLITLEGIRKPAWYAHWFLSLLGEEILIQEEEYIVTRRGEDIQILAFSYVYYDDIYRAGDRSLLTYDRRYDVFEAKDEIHLRIQIDNISGRYEKRDYILDRSHGSAYDIFQKMGSPNELTLEDVAYLKGMARPKSQVSTVLVQKELTFDFVIPPHGIHMVLLKKLLQD